MADPRLKTIKIKSGVVKRLAKERSMYEKQVEQEKVRLQKFKDQGKDEYDIRKQEEVIQECVMMVPETQKRFLSAFQDLSSILEAEKELKEADEYKNARLILDDVKALTCESN
ncbi:tubulin-specific chaperone A [Ischnura elegans]|uniref:tubulin-specific chaperone A n=1 Tax=Ischnura elegans TaxID=197161 RepID=UPI001ED87DF3|nr:tubulin-specific chaperone A [Ischnura elegans]